MIDASHTLTFSSSFFQFLSNPHTLCVDTSNKSSTKNYGNKTPIINVFQSLPEQKQQQRKVLEKVTHTSYEKKHTQTREGGVLLIFLGKDKIMPVK